MDLIRSIALGFGLCWLCGGCLSPLVVEGEIRGDAFARLVAITSKARGIESRRVITARTVSRLSLTGVLRESIRTNWSEERLENYRAALHTMGLWPSGVDIETNYIEHVSNEVTGLYIPANYTIYLLQEPSPRMASPLGLFLDEEELFVESVLAHEIVHALQHQSYPDLVEFGRHYPDQDDAESAIQAALEGDAMHFGLLAVDRFAGTPGDREWVEVDRSLADATLEETLGSEDVPSILRRALVFPYAAGTRLAAREGRDLLEDPPVSTEQVLHSDKRRESFLAIDLADVIAEFPEDCKPLHDNTVGELGISILLGDFEAEAIPEAWRGWDGDRFAAAGCAAGNEFIWITQWDSNSDASEFESAYRSIAMKIAKRANHEAEPTTQRVGSRVTVASERFSDFAGPWSERIRVSRVANMRDFRRLPAPASSPSKNPDSATYTRWQAFRPGL
jgi:hypothetical protein